MEWAYPDWRRRLERWDRTPSRRVARDAVIWLFDLIAVWVLRR